MVCLLCACLFFACFIFTELETPVPNRSSDPAPEIRFYCCSYYGALEAPRQLGAAVREEKTKGAIGPPRASRPFGYSEAYRLFKGVWAPRASCALTLTGLQALEGQTYRLFEGHMGPWRVVLEEPIGG